MKKIWMVLAVAVLFAFGTGPAFAVESGATATDTTQKPPKPAKQKKSVGVKKHHKKHGVEQGETAAPAPKA